jgi:hypothetical protein
MKKPWVLHPFLVAPFPVLFLYAQNLDQLSWSQTWPSLRFVGGASLLLFLLFALILRNVKKAGIIISLFVLLFFSYTRVVNLLSSGPVNLVGVDTHWIVFIVWCLVFAGVTASVVRTNRALDDATRILNITALVLVSIPLVNIGTHEVRSAATGQAHDRIQITELPPVESIPESELPNIYYIILDAYGRADILADIYQYDNTEFLTYLREKGFYVAEQSHSNYTQTDLSLASSLNASYLDKLAAEVGLDSGDRKPAQELIQDSAVVQLLKEHGYKIITLSSGYEATDLRSVDEYRGQKRTLNALELAVFVSTPIPWLMYREIGATPYDPHRQTILSAFDQLASAADLPGPHFLFAHILVPHPPFVFDRYGNEIVPKGDYSLFDGEAFLRTGTREEYLRGYTDQLIFANNKLRIALDELIARSSRPTIIVLQADHGPGSLLHWQDCDNACLKERFSILNAYLLPDAGSTELYPEISPVNTFRVILNHYLGTNLDMLDDRSYFSTWGRPYAFSDVTDAIRCTEPSCGPKE